MTHTLRHILERQTKGRKVEKEEFKQNGVTLTERYINVLDIIGKFHSASIKSLMFLNLFEIRVELRTLNRNRNGLNAIRKFWLRSGNGTEINFLGHRCLNCTAAS